MKLWCIPLLVFLVNAIPLGLERSVVEVPIYEYPQLEFHQAVHKACQLIDQNNMRVFLSDFTHLFPNRYYTTHSGKESSLWLYDYLLKLTEPFRQSVGVSLFDHKNWAQKSIIVTLHGKSAQSAKIILGSHLDSFNLFFPTIFRSPGADDDGSGVATLVEALRVILSEGLAFENTVEFHFYAAEEGGLLGSNDIFRHYKGQKIVAMMQQDMTGYGKDSFAVLQDHSSSQLNGFIKSLATSYCSIPLIDTVCGYACSDHASALQYGFPSTLVTESLIEENNPFVHSGKDTADLVSFRHMAEHVKLCLGYVIELGNWKYTESASVETVEFSFLDIAFKRFFMSHYMFFSFTSLLSCLMIAASACYALRVCRKLLRVSIRSMSGS